MRNRLGNLRPALVSVLFFSLSTFMVFSLLTVAEPQQQQQQQRYQPRELPPYRAIMENAPVSKDGFVEYQGQRLETAAIQFDIRDLSGIYRSVAGGRESFGDEQSIPPMTTAGREELAKRISADRVSDPALSNDPQFDCDPQGFPRLFLDHELIENIHLDGRILQLSQWDQTLREIWMDGRKLPTPEEIAELGPAFYGYSVGRWQGDTLIVDTVGMDPRNWIDDDTGYPYSSEARIEERYRRVGPDVVVIQHTLYDPKFYAAPWVGDLKPMRRMPRALVTHAGWFGLFSGVVEAICAPMNELEFHERNAPAYNFSGQPQPPR
jgi:hypothetical protein